MRTMLVNASFEHVYEVDGGVQIDIYDGFDDDTSVCVLTFYATHAAKIAKPVPNYGWEMVMGG
jgi:hypothetical protein